MFIYFIYFFEKFIYDNSTGKKKNKRLNFT